MVSSLESKLIEVLTNLGLFFKKHFLPNYQVVLIVQLSPSKFIEIKVPEGKDQIDISATLRFPPDIEMRYNGLTAEKKKEFFYRLKRDLNCHPISFTLLPPAAFQGPEKEKGGALKKEEKQGGGREGEGGESNQVHSSQEVSSFSAFASPIQEEKIIKKTGEEQPAILEEPLVFGQSSGMEATMGERFPKTGGAPGFPPPMAGGVPHPFRPPTQFPAGVGIITTLFPENLTRTSLKAAIDSVARAIYTVTLVLEYFFAPPVNFPHSPSQGHSRRFDHDVI